jgi:hypothetical protein
MIRVVQEVRMVFLYNRLGDCLSFSIAGWKEVLDNAGSHGWKAMGTIPPPVRLDLDSQPSETLTWDGNYARPLGQMVTPEDAAALAAAVERALTFETDWNVNRRSALRAFTSFCRQRGFLLSSNPFTNRPPAAIHYKIAS